MRILFATVILAVVVVVSQATASAQVYRFQSYTASTGMPSNLILCVYQDRNGYMWFGTDGGACRYDGVGYVTFDMHNGLPDNSVRAIFEDLKGNIWFMTGNGACRYDGETFSTLTTREGLIDNQLYSGLCARDGTIWFGAINGVCRYDGARIAAYGVAAGVPAAPVWDMIEDRTGVIWLATRGDGIAKFDGQRFTAYRSAQGLPNDRVFGLREGPNGGLWIGTNGGLCFFDGTSYYVYTTADGLSSNLVGKVLVDRGGRVWCGTFGGGLCRLDGDRFTVFDQAKGLPDNFLTAVLEDSEGNIWGGTLSSGMFRFSNESFTAYTAAAGVGTGRISGVAETPDGTLWVTSVNDGLAALTPQGTVRRYGVPGGTTEETLQSLYCDSRGRLWAGGTKSVLCFDAGRFTTYPIELLGVNERVSSILEDRQGGIWFGCYTVVSRGLARFDGKTFKLFTTADGLSKNCVNAMFVDASGKFWVGTEAGVCVFDGERFVPFAYNDRLQGRWATALAEDAAGRLWIGTNDGLFCFTAAQCTLYTVQNGLAGNNIRALVAQGERVWIGTTHGVSLFDGKAFESYTAQDGLVSDEISTGGILPRRDGSVWFGTNQGVACYRPRPAIAKPNALRVRVTSLRAGERLVPLRDSIELAKNENSLTFEFLAPAFSSGVIQYSYLLTGLTPQWSRPGPDRQVRFINLPPGDYTFQVMARAPNGDWSRPHRIAFHLSPPVWQTWWFRLGGGMAVVLAVYGAFTWRTFTLKRKQRLRENDLRRIQEQQLANLRQLLESIQVINSRLDLMTVLQNLVEESARLVDGRPGGVGLIEGDKLVFKRGWQRGQWVTFPVEVPLGQGITGEVAAEGKATIVENVSNNPKLYYRGEGDPVAFDGMMVVPIIARNGNTVGVFVVRRGKGRASFTEDDLKLVSSLTNQAAVAIENAALYGELAEKTDMIGASMREVQALYAKEQDVTRTLQELNRMKTNFMMVTSHEMRTPLAVLKGYGDVLLSEMFGTLTARQRESLESCRRMTDRMITTFADIETMLRVESGRIELRPVDFDLSGLVRGVVAELNVFASRRRQEISLDAPESLAVTLDWDKVEFVIINIIQNAIKFTPDGGRIAVGVADEGDAIHLTVADSGVGIPAADLTRIFETFYTAADTTLHHSGEFEFSARGAGLGLAIGKGYIEIHGGRVWAESAGPGTGSTFHVVLPKTLADGRSSEGTPMPEAVAGATAVPPSI